MSVYTCKKCGKKFETKGFTDGFCEECAADYQDKYHQVREYLWKHPGSNASAVAKACDCSVRQVMQWVKEDRFMLSDDSRVSLYCEICGTKIFSGRYCAACQTKAERKAKDDALSARIRQHTENMHGTTVERPSADDGRMRFLH
ncbi:MAG: hypothetical protein IJT96_02610 [Lachnospiraceae bacterium]|nr:hypothetical protein [Lachnospiraceae bacterium]